jgi:hypothetical protein
MNFGETEIFGCHENTHKKILLGSDALLLMKLLNCSNILFLNYFIYVERHYLRQRPSAHPSDFTASSLRNLSYHDQHMKLTFQNRRSPRNFHWGSGGKRDDPRDSLV